MPFKPHKVFEEPENKKSPIWRYLDSTQFISLLKDRQLYFSRTDKFPDTFEGVPPESTLKDMKQRAKEYNKEIDEQVNSGEYPTEFAPALKRSENPLEVIELFRVSHFVNCWTMRKYESKIMWDSYVQSGDGVVIKSTYDKLKSALDIHGDYEYSLAKVKYRDFSNMNMVLENLRYPFGFKQMEYKDEKEIRAVVYRIPFDTDDPRPGSIPKSNWDGHPTGIPVKTDLNDLIDEIRISPNAPSWVNLEYWENLCRKYRLWSPEIRFSRLKHSPEDLADLESVDIGDYVRRMGS